MRRGHQSAYRTIQPSQRRGGISLLPCYLGDADRDLTRIGFERKNALLAEVTAEQYLLVHNDLRNLPRVRAVMDAIIRLFQQDKLLLAGESR